MNNDRKTTGTGICSTENMKKIKPRVTTIYDLIF